MGRVMDAPVYQDILTWNGGAGLVKGPLGSCVSSVEHRTFATSARHEGECGLLADG